MSWHYQVRRREDKGDVYFDIVEIYTDPPGWTRDSIAPIGDSPEELMRVLEMMLADAKKYPVLIDEDLP
jgi:hypothetical protein